MKRTLQIIILNLIALPALAQNWTWMRGSTTGSIAGVYGTQGTSSASNDPGGRHGAATWTDNSGNLWVFGGEGFSNTSTVCWLNDLWKYNKATNEWTWIRGSNGPNASGVYGTKGTPSSLNDPGAREFSVCWTDTAGNFWLFGGDGYDGTGTFGKLADLWKYNPATNQWTYMHGSNVVDQYGVYGTQGVASSSNMPGGRMGSGSWVDNNNNFFLFGGDGYASTGSSAKLNDMWKYVPSTNQWTWIKGSNLVTQASTYGTFSVASTANIPGGRSFSACWYLNGNMYLFGGVGHANTTLNSRLGEFWKYDPSTNNWAWIGGAAVGNQNGNYGTKGVASAGNIPGSRFSSAAWTDALGNLWLFGGNGYPGQGSPGLLNDLFKYNPSASAWTWVKGDSTTYSISNYGTMGVTAVSNTPGARMYNTWWTNTGSRLWLLGGEERNDTTFVNDHLNDLWLFEAPCNPDSVTIVGAQAICPGNTATLTITPPDNSGVSWYSSATSTAALASTTTFVTPPLSAGSSSGTVTYYVGVATCSQSPRTAVTLTIFSPALLSILPPSIPCAEVTLTFVASGAQTYTWYNGANMSVLTTTLPAGNYTAWVTGTNANGCIGSDTLYSFVHPKPQVTVSGPTVACAGSAVVFTATGASSYTWGNGSTGSTCTMITGPDGTISYGWAAGTATNGCQADDSLAVTAIPVPTLNVMASNSVVCNQDAAKLTATGASTYSWSTGHTTSVITHTAVGYKTYTFSVTGTGTNGCSSTATVSYIRSECIGIEENQRAPGLNIYPNPSEGTFIIETLDPIGKGVISIVNSLGQVVWSKNLSDAEKKFEVNLPPGIYHCTITSGNGGRQESKLIVR